MSGLRPDILFEREKKEKKRRNAEMQTRNPNKMCEKFLALPDAA